MCVYERQAHVWDDVDYTYEVMGDRTRPVCDVFDVELRKKVAYREME